MTFDARAGVQGSHAMTGGPVRSLLANPAIAHLRHEVQREGHWYVALLEAIGLWEEPTERFRGRTLTYLIAGEALDWLLLAGRLCREVQDRIPPAELDRLLFQGEAPIIVDSADFRDLVGPLKYRCFLNYFYGVTVEEALFFVLEEEARRHAVTPGGSFDLNPLYLDLYGASEGDLLKEFLGESVQKGSPSLDVQEQKAFTYFLFKRRIQYCLPPRVASDTKRGLAELRRQYLAAGRPAPFPGRPDGRHETPEGAPFASAATA